MPIVGDTCSASANARGVTMKNAATMIQLNLRISGSPPLPEGVWHRDSLRMSLRRSALKGRLPYTEGDRVSSVQTTAAPTPAPHSGPGTSLRARRCLARIGLRDTFRRPTPERSKMRLGRIQERAVLGRSIRAAVYVGRHPATNR